LGARNGGLGLRRGSGESYDKGVVARCGMDMIRCPRCAREIPDTSRFCRRCGCAIVWRAELLPPVIATPQEAPRKPITLNKPLTQRTLKQKSWRCQGGSAGGGGGLFALLAMGGMICFVNYHAVVRPVRPTPTVNFPTPPTLPMIPRTHISATRVRTTPAPARWMMPPAPPVPSRPPVVIEPPQGPIYWGPYDQPRGRGPGG